MFGNPYFNNYNTQPSLDRINAQINELEKMKEQMQKPIQPTPTNLTQNFQLAPQRDVIKYATSMDEVQRDMVIGDTPFFSKDMSVVWVKSTNGEIKTYELNEIIQKDEKDMRIEYLQAQIEQLRKEVNKDESSTDANKSVTNTNKSKESPGISESTEVYEKSE